jgi:hypothetical protein
VIIKKNWDTHVFLLFVYIHITIYII